jgi:hypothetical protein
VAAVCEPPDGGGRALRRERPGPNTTATPTPIRTTDGLSVADGVIAERQARARIAAQDGPAECRGCGEITDLIQGSDWCWTCVYTDSPYIDYAGRPTLAGDDPWRTVP